MSFLYQVGRQTVRQTARQTADFQPTVGRLSADCWPTVCVMFEAKVMAGCRPTVGRQLVTCWQPVGNVSVTCRRGKLKFTCLLLLNYAKRVKVIS